MKKVLVIGANGNIGRRLVEHFGDRAIGCYRTQVTNGLVLDITKNRIHDCLEAPETVSHAIIVAGITNPALIVDDPEKARAVNVDATWRLIEDLADLGIVPIFTSSDALLGLGSGPFTEKDPVRPETLYGQMKWDVEKRLLSMSSETLVLRLPRIYGLTIDDGTLITGLFEKIRQGGKVSVATDQRFSPLYVGDLAVAIEKAIRSQLNGLYNLGGDEVVTHEDIAEKICDAMSKHRSVDAEIDRKGINDFVSYETRPLDISMNSSKIKDALDLSFLNISDAVQRVVTSSLQ